MTTIDSSMMELLEIVYGGASVVALKKTVTYTSPRQSEFKLIEDPWFYPEIYAPMVVIGYSVDPEYIKSSQEIVVLRAYKRAKRLQKNRAELR